mgnify:CR=1 FL=1
MSELPHQDEMQGELSPPIPINRKRKSAEVIDFSKASAELATGLFMTELRHPSRASLHGQNLAIFIQSEMTTDESDDPTKLGSRLAYIINSVDAFGDEAMFDHKVEHDEVFKALVEKLQNTRRPTDELRDQRRAALKLTELRAALQDDKTDDDATWHDVISRLFS